VDAESFIPYVLATDAVERDVEVANGEPLILGVDIGRFGDDPSVVAPGEAEMLFRSPGKSTTA
jgi:hypothetical protein